MGSVAVHRFEHDAMTTRFGVAVVGHEAEYARQASAAVFREIDRLEGLLSRFDAGSDIGQLNLLKPGDSMHLNPEVMECLQIGLWAHAETGGAFDIALAGPAGLSDLVLDPESFMAKLSDQAPGGLQLDLGGLGKGFALDVCGDLLAEWQIDNALLDAGTSTVLALGDGEDGSQQGWVVGVGGDWDLAAGGTTVRLKDCAVSGSGEEVKGGHILDPRTGEPATGHEAAWAVSASAAASDVLSTAFMVLTTEDVAAYCARHVGAEVYVVADGVLRRISGDEDS